MGICSKRRSIHSKRRKPSFHFRIVHTKQGLKRRAINRHIRKPTKLKPYGVINKVERRVFTHLSNPRTYNIEFGGGLDFNRKGQLENINVVPGKNSEVDLPDEDWEVMYHTHHAPDYMFSPPSPDDVYALLTSKKQQAELVFKDGQAWQIVKTPSTKALSKLPATQLQEKLDKAFLNSRSNNWDQDWKKELEDMGFMVFITNRKTGKLKLRIHPQERGIK